MLAPRVALRTGVEQHRLEPVHRGGKLRLRRLFGLKLVPQRTKLRGLVLRQQPEDARGRPHLALVLPRNPRRIVGERVTRIDLHEIVEDHHLQHAQHIERRTVRVLREHDHAQTKVPGMLGVVFRATALREDRLPENLLQLVHLDDELDLPGEALDGRADGLRRFHADKNAPCARAPQPPNCPGAVTPRAPITNAR